MKGKVIAKALNIRTQPVKDAEIAGKLLINDVVEILESKDGWYKIKFNDSTAFVVSEFVEEIVRKGSVNANLLNIRVQPDKNAEKIDKLTKNEEVIIIEESDGWYKIKYKDGFGFVFSQFIDLEGVSSEKTFLFKDPELIKIPLEPEKKLNEAGSSVQKKVISIYNQYGNLLNVLSKKLNVDIAASIAVITTESGGDAMKDGRLVIRFENHVFYNNWGKTHLEEFQKYFKFSAKPAPAFKGHKYRINEDGEWKDTHQNQDSEYEALNLARSFDNQSGLLSISMGLVQMMGFNAKSIGYDTAQEMFDKFSADARYHIFGFFDFVTSAHPKAIDYLRKKDFVNFALQYNGKGQEQYYGSIMKKYYDAFPSNLI